MTDENPYAPPTADLLPEASEQTGPWYHPVSPTKFALLYFLTFGLYPIVWFYRQWKLVKAREGTNIWPVARGLFSIFFAHALFRRIAETASERGIELTWSPNAQATWYVVLKVVGNLADRISAQSHTLGLAELVVAIVFVAIYFPLREVQKDSNRINGDPLGMLNDRYPAATVLVMVVGGLVWLLMIIGLLTLMLGVGRVI